MNDATARNEPAEELALFAQAAREALSDVMVERLAVTAGNALEILDRLNDEGTRNALHLLLDRLGDLYKTGAIDTLFDTVLLMHSARNAATDPMIDRLFTFFEQMINTVGNEDMGRVAANSRLALEEAAEEARQATPRGGVLATLSLLSRPETQRSLSFLLSFGEKLQRRTAGLDSA